jgi:hypothetical protein
MALGLIVGLTLVAAGLLLLCHLSYTELSEKHKPADPEDPTNSGQACSKAQNDCLLPMCFFQFSRVRNHETWIIACLLSGAAILIMSLT